MTFLAQAWRRKDRVGDAAVSKGTTSLYQSSDVVPRGGPTLCVTVTPPSPLATGGGGGCGGATDVDTAVVVDAEGSSPGRALGCVGGVGSTALGLLLLPSVLLLPSSSSIAVDCRPSANLASPRSKYCNMTHALHNRLLEM